jgi:ATP-dependent DNA ligase
MVLNEHHVDHGEIVYQQACQLGCEGVVAKKNPAAPRRDHCRPAAGIAAAN